MFEYDPQTKEQWSQLLEYLYQAWRKAKRPVTFYPIGYVKGALRLDGVISGKQIGSIVS